MGWIWSSNITRGNGCALTVFTPFQVPSTILRQASKSFSPTHFALIRVGTFPSKDDWTDSSPRSPLRQDGKILRRRRPATQPSREAKSQARTDAGSELAGFRASRPIIHTRNYFSAAARHCEIFKSPFPSREVEEERSEGRKGYDSPDDGRGRGRGGRRRGQ